MPVLTGHRKDVSKVVRTVPCAALRPLPPLRAKASHTLKGIK